MTSISDWVRQEEPEIGDVLLVNDGRGLMPVQVLARHDENHFDVQPFQRPQDGTVAVDDVIVNGDDELVLAGPFSVTVLDEDGHDHVRHFRTPHAARIYAAKQTGAVAEGWN